MEAKLGVEPRASGHEPNMLPLHHLAPDLLNLDHYFKWTKVNSSLRLRLLILTFCCIILFGATREVLSLSTSPREVFSTTAFFSEWRFSRRNSVLKFPNTVCLASNKGLRSTVLLSLKHRLPCEHLMLFIDRSLKN